MESSFASAPSEAAVQQPQEPESNLEVLEDAPEEPESERLHEVVLENAPEKKSTRRCLSVRTVTSGDDSESLFGSERDDQEVSEADVQEPVLPTGPSAQVDDLPQNPDEDAQTDDKFTSEETSAPISKTPAQAGKRKREKDEDEDVETPVKMARTVHDLAQSAQSIASNFWSSMTTSLWGGSPAPPETIAQTDASSSSSSSNSTSNAPPSNESSVTKQDVELAFQAGVEVGKLQAKDPRNMLSNATQTKLLMALIQATEQAFPSKSSSSNGDVDAQSLE